MSEHESFNTAEEAALQRLEQLKQEIAETREQNVELERHADNAVRGQKLAAEAARLEEELKFERHRNKVLREQNQTFNAPSVQQIPPVEQSKSAPTAPTPPPPPSPSDAESDESGDDNETKGE